MNAAKTFDKISRELSAIVNDIGGKSLDADEVQALWLKLYALRNVAMDAAGASAPAAGAAGWTVREPGDVFADGDEHFRVQRIDRGGCDRAGVLVCEVIVGTNPNRPIGAVQQFCAHCVNTSIETSGGSWRFVRAA